MSGEQIEDKGLFIVNRESSARAAYHGLKTPAPDIFRSIGEAREGPVAGRESGCRRRSGDTKTADIAGPHRA
ncbi:MAG: hypothetical protein R3C97_08635 [Geminicoccaceae bacterium]